ncbi:hypothetical protein BaRGS_00023245, partial [Batillaria attramentaria]
MDETVMVVSEYIKWCEQKEIPTKKVKVFPNSKPWVTKELKETICRKREAYLNNDIGAGRQIQKELGQQIRKAKSEYKDKIELLFRGGYMHDAWKGLKSMA